MLAESNISDPWKPQIPPKHSRTDSGFLESSIKPEMRAKIGATKPSRKYLNSIVLLSER